ncbi:protein kinase-like protein [Williamsia muralis]|nr:protein kinase-like protein [Williamsia marianensis]
MRYEGIPIGNDYLELYVNIGPFEKKDPISIAFASIHERLDSELDWMNQKARYGGHFNAENSRTLLDLIDEVAELKLALAKAGKSLKITPEYERVLTDSKEWLVASGGSPIPDGFTPVLVEKYEAVFGLADAEVVLADNSKVSLIHVGEGAYAHVHKFVDPNYNLTFARKKLKADADDRDRERFRREYEIMNGLDFPYILKVYRYDEAQNSYTMEFCESTLEKYVKQRNNQAALGFGVRRKIAVQFLYGLNHLHVNGICHRDLSLNNVLLRVFSSGPVTVKLSDFGLAKPSGSDFTKTETEIRGTIVDTALNRFKDFEPVNDIYAVGFVLSYIFEGVRHLLPGSTPLGEIVQKCSNNDPSLRFQTVLEIVAALEKLKAEPPV